jgi:hypothetical protein
MCFKKFVVFLIKIEAIEAGLFYALWLSREL